MRIFIDIGHPAHVHYFRNFIKIMQSRGNDFFISARNKEVSQILLEKYNIPYYSRGKGSNHIAGKIAYLFRADWLLYRKAKKFKPDLFLSFTSPYATHVAKIVGKPHISFTDTDKARLGILSFAPLTECIVTPDSFRLDFGSKHIRFNGFMELCYLNDKYYKPDSDILKDLGLKKDESYAVLRFVSWSANHDPGNSGISDKNKLELVKELKKRIKVFISSEGELPKELLQYKINISPEKIHDLLSFATLYIGEGATMASESAMLGTPAIYVNTLSAGTLISQEKYGLLFCYKSSDHVTEKALDLIAIPNLKEEWQKRRGKMLAEQIDVTAFMVWFIENYPESAKIMREQPEYQEKFRTKEH
jgi:predicted glycosyltransferase